MELQGRVENGVVVFPGGFPLPDGATVSVVYPAKSGGPQSNATKQRIELPLVHSDKPGSICLTNEQIGEILDAEDAAP
jgi:hypothetical protein